MSDAPGGQSAGPESEATPPIDRPALTPMDLGQVVDALIALYRQRPWLLLGLCAVLQVPAAILTGVILLPLPDRIEAMVGFDPFDPPATFDASTVLPTPSNDQILSVMVPIWLAVLVTIVASTLTTVAIAQAVSRLHLGRAASVTAALAAVLRRLGPILGALVISTVALIGLVALAVIAFVVLLGLAPGATAGGPLAFAAVLALAAVLVLAAFVSIRWILWPQAVVLDATGVVGSLGRSWRLVAGSTLRVIGYALLFGFAAGIVQGLLAQLGLIGVEALSGILPGALRVVLAFAVNTLATLLLAPVVPVAMTLLYLDLRVRRGEHLA